MLVEMCEVLKVRDLTRAPQLCERCDVSMLKQVGQIGGQDVVVDIVTKLHPEKHKLSITRVRTEVKHGKLENVI